MEHTDLILTSGRYLPDPGDPEGRLSRLETYLTALSRELEEITLRAGLLVAESERRLSALESAAASAGAVSADATMAGGDES